MYLERGDDQVIGLYYELDNWKPILLGGSWHDDGSVELQEPADRGTVDLELQFKDGGLIGEGDRKAQLHRSPQPSCAIGGPSKTFSHPSLPFTFDYPATWRVMQVEDGFEVTCPDPASMAYGEKVSITHGLPVDFRPGANNKWVYGSGIEATMTTRGLLRIFSADHFEGRSYCIDGGYRGAAEGHRYAVKVGRAWFEISGMGSMAEETERVARSLQMRGPQP